MSIRFSCCLLAPLMVASAVTLFAEVTPAPVFQDHAVLQRNIPVPIWGQADAGEKVTVTFADQTKSTVAAKDGRWRVVLDPMDANAAPATLTITGENTLTFSDVLVGEVWLAAGQSNMGRTVQWSYEHAIDIPASTNPLIRHLNIARNTAATPVTTLAGVWQAASPETTGSFSAVAYYFSSDIQALLRVPVGIIHSSWGGTPAEAWTDADTLGANPAFSYVAEEWTEALAVYPQKKAKHTADLAAWQKAKAEAAAAGKSFTRSAPREPKGPGHKATPSGLYNGMIHPLTPYALRGVIWYQGENNTDHPGRYHALFSAMIEGWRAKFGQPRLPFYWVQLPNYSSATGTNWALLREAQTKTLALPATGQAVTIDLGDQKDIHPLNKKDVGRRLSRLALARNYGFKIIDSGPVFEKAEREGAGFRVTFKSDAKLRAPLHGLPGFEVAGADKVFHPAEAKIDENAVLVSSAEVSEPVAVRYAWRDAPVAGLFNDEGLPAAPFRTDSW